MDAIHWRAASPTSPTSDMPPPSIRTALGSASSSRVPPTPSRHGRPHGRRRPAHSHRARDAVAAKGGIGCARPAHPGICRGRHRTWARRRVWPSAFAQSRLSWPCRHAGSATAVADGLRYLGTYRRHRRLDGDGRRSQDRNLLLLLFVLFENFQTFNSRSEHHSVIRQRFFANPFLALSVIGAQALHITAMHLPLLAATEGGARCLGPRAFLSGSNVGRRPFRRSPPD
jgi:hypothetical protein